MINTSGSQYFRRFASPDPVLNDPVDPSCKIIIVIPCYNESDLIGTLDSLLASDPIDSHVEVIVVLNDREDTTDRIRNTNEKSCRDFHLWVQKSANFRIRFHLIEALSLPKKTGGVGLARKIGMDEALRRFISIDQDGAIVCLDADCRVSNGYLKAISDQFVDSDAGVGEMRFAHQHEKETDPRLKRGIINYELFLRFYVEGLKQSKFPNAIHTIGSCMLVKASVYAKHGGMNKRKAGEDFYFLHKIVPHEKFTTVTNGIVHPSCRTSDRVPFGTGKAQNDWLNQTDNVYLTYDPRVFDDLKTINQSVDSLFKGSFEVWISELPLSVKQFFNEHHYMKKVKLIKSNCKTTDQFKKQFYIWFDGFLCLKFIHFVRDRFYPNISIDQAASKLISTKELNPTLLLEIYKKKELEG